MIKNYLKTAFRNLQRNKSYAIINIFGLAVGVAACLLIFLVIRFETSFDTFHKNRKATYRLISEFHTQDGISYSSGVPFPVAPALRLDYPQLRQVACIFEQEDMQITIPGDQANQRKKLNEKKIFFAEPEFFNVFDFAWLSGDPKTSLSEPNSVVLTQQTAVKYFTDWKTAIGKTITYDNKYSYKVTGILKDLPVNTDFPINVVISYATLKNTEIKRNLNDWVSTFSDAYTFVVLPTEITPTRFKSDLASFTKKHKPSEYAKDGIILQPLNEIHYDSRTGNYNHTFSKQLISTLFIIGIFLVVIACVNFVNLATAQAINRSKEVGVRKVLGSNRTKLFFQFISETAIITTFAILLAVGVAAFVLPFLNTLLETEMQWNFLRDPFLISFLLLLGLVITVLSGTYPAIILSGFNPINALKNKISA
ncbi:MAG TPA: ABC transporter permease, partial [Puia sp.]|nr:ABC transporter permease [Puia sp.]